MMVTTRALDADDRAGWETLYRGYADFYGVDTDMRKLDTLFTWLLDGGHPCCGLVAEGGDGGLAGLAHYRAMPSPLRGAEIGFLDDLFVAPESRGQGVARELVEHLRGIASRSGWGVVRWITREDNADARALYDSLAHRSNWITYELDPLAARHAGRGHASDRAAGPACGGTAEFGVMAR